MHRDSRVVLDDLLELVERGGPALDPGGDPARVIVGPEIRALGVGEPRPEAQPLFLEEAISDDAQDHVLRRLRGCRATTSFSLTCRPRST